MRLKHLLSVFLTLLTLSVGQMWADTYEQLTSIANIDESAEYVLGIDGTGFHYSGTSSWGSTALPSAQAPIKYTLKKANDGNSFTAKATISSTTYYLQVPTSNTFSMATSTGTNTDLIIGTTQVSGTNYAVANKTTTARHLRINGTSGLRSYAGTTGTMAFFYKVVSAVPRTVSWSVNGNSYTAGNPTTSVNSGSKVTTLPTAPGSALCDGNKVFMGWTSSSINGSTNTKPTDLFTTAAEAPTVSANVTYYAVFADENEEESSKTYELNITADNFNTTSYAANNNEKTSDATATDNSGAKISVKWTSNQVMKNSSNMQWQKSAGYIYNSTDLGTVNSVTITSSAGSFTTYYGTSKQPSSGSSATGKGFFKSSVGSATGTTSSMVVNFTKTQTVTIYSNYATSCCSPLGSINGSFFGPTFFRI